MSDPATTTKEKGKSIRDASVGRSDIYQVDPDSIDVVKGFNPRKFTVEQNKAHLANIATSILAEGIQEPLWVTFNSTTGRFTLINGETRLRAVRIINKREPGKFPTVPVIRKTGDEAELLALAMTANTGKPFSMVELGDAFKRLVGFGWDHAAIAARWNMSVKKVEECILLTDADDNIKQLIAESAVTPAYVVAQIKKHGGNASWVIKNAVAATRPAKTDPAPVETKENPTPDKPEVKRKRGRPKNENKKVKPLARGKKKGGEFIKDDVLTLIRTALTLAGQSDDVNVSTAAKVALEKLPVSEISDSDLVL